MAKLKVDQTLRRATSHLQKGEVDAARKLYLSVLEVFPKNARAQQGLARLARPAPTTAQTPAHPPQAALNDLLALYHDKQNDRLITQTKALLETHPTSYLLHNMLGAGYRRVSQFEDAEKAFGHALRHKPDAQDVHRNLGMTLMELGKPDAAIRIYEALIALNPNDADAYKNMGLALRETGQPEKALAAFDKALEIDPAHAEAFNGKGLTFYQQNQDDAALAAYARALAINPDFIAAHYNTGNVLKRKAQLTQAIEAYRKALALNPEHADALNNLGTTLTKQTRFAEAQKVLEKAVALRPDNWLMRMNLGNVWLEQNELPKALALYEDLLKQHPDYAECYNNLGLTLHEMGKYDAAIAAFEKALSLNEASSETYTNMGNTLSSMRHLDKAILAYRRAIELKPDAYEVESALFHQMQHACDWSCVDEMQARMPHLGTTGIATAPFGMIAMEDHPERQCQRSQRWVETKHKYAPRHARPNPAPSDRLRIGYFSADFKNHPCLYLMMGVLRSHDASRFEISAFSYGKDKSGDLRDQAIAEVEHFHDVAEMSDADLIAFARTKELDIAIDLMGHTANVRLELFKGGLAPVQVSFVGFPGTTGADYIDYLVGDHTVIPPAHRQAYTENILYMPHTYLPNDNQLPISDKVTTRTDFGLPEDAFVLCCFNNNYKISPAEFDIWMRVLNKVDDAVLWMLKSNPQSEANLQQAATDRGVDPARIIVGKKLPHPEHMARHRHADLFLDTFHYNAHTTACEALWAGLPIITKQGEQFAARVAASMLLSVGLPELITTSDQEYEALILALAEDRDTLRQLTQKLDDNRLTQPLFDSQKFTRNLEDGLSQIHALYRTGAAAQDIHLAPHT